MYNNENAKMKIRSMLYKYQNLLSEVDASNLDAKSALNNIIDDLIELSTILGQGKSL